MTLKEKNYHQLCTYIEQLSIDESTQKAIIDQHFIDGNAEMYFVPLF